jgi:type IV pilus assembly protein PilC
MPLIIAPGQFSQRAEFYYQLNQLASAGIGLVPALERLGRNPPARSYREPIQRVLEQLAKGRTLSESLECAGPWLPAFDVTLIEAGEKSGKLDQSFRTLADFYNERARLYKQMIADLLYPVFLYHFAILIFALLQFVRSGNWLLVLLVGLIPVYAITAFLIYAGQSKHGETWRAWVETLLHPLPVLGKARRYLALARMSAVLEALVSAGVTIVEAWEMAATASGSPALRQTVLAWRPLLNAGQTPSEIIAKSSKFPELFSNQYASGEISGKLDETLRRLHQYYQDEGSRKLRAVTKWVPFFIYLGVMFLIAWFVIRFWLGQFQDIRNAGGF